MTPGGSVTICLSTIRKGKALWHNLLSSKEHLK